MFAKVDSWDLGGGRSEWASNFGWYVSLRVPHLKVAWASIEPKQDAFLGGSKCRLMVACKARLVCEERQCQAQLQHRPASERLFPSIQQVAMHS